jgi:hypothetical protein
VHKAPRTLAVVSERLPRLGRRNARPAKKLPTAAPASGEHQKAGALLMIMCAPSARRAGFVVIVCARSARRAVLGADEAHVIMVATG